VGAVTVDLAGLLGMVLVVILVFSGIIVVGCIVFIGCIIGIGCVSGIVIRKAVVLRINPARMLAFSASRSMHCSGTGFAVLLVFSVFVVSGIVISIVIVVGIIVWRVVVSCSKPAQMLAFSTSKLMHCSGGVMGSGVGVRAVALVGTGGGSSALLAASSLLALSSGRLCLKSGQQGCWLSAHQN